MANDLSKLAPTRLPARLVPYVDAVATARSRGVTWYQIAEALAPVLNLDMTHRRDTERRLQKAFKSALQQIEKGRLRPISPSVAGLFPGKQVLGKQDQTPATGFGGARSTFQFDDDN
ncbi:MAG: hypothetical protein ACYDEV_08840 [Acidiferrobacter sp.]